MKFLYLSKYGLAPYPLSVSASTGEPQRKTSWIRSVSAISLSQPRESPRRNIENVGRFLDSGLTFSRHGDKLFLQIVVRALWNPAFEFILAPFLVKQQRGAIHALVRLSRHSSFFSSRNIIHPAASAYLCHGTLFSVFCSVDRLRKVSFFAWFSGVSFSPVLSSK